AELVGQGHRFRVVHEVVELVDEYEYVHGSRSLLAWTDGRAGLRTGKELLETTGDARWNEVVHVASEGSDLLDAARGEEAVLRAGHQVHGFHLGRELAVEMVHLELPLEVGDRAEALDHRARAPAAGELDDELREHLDLDVLEVGEGLAEEVDTVLDREERLLVLRVTDDADNDPLEDSGGPPDDVDVPVRHRVVAPGA